MMKKMKNGEKVIKMQKVGTSRDCKRLLLSRDHRTQRYRSCECTLSAVSVLHLELATMRRDV